MSYTIRIEERINSIERTVEVTGDEPQATLDVMRAVRAADAITEAPPDYQSAREFHWKAEAERLRGEIAVVRTERDAYQRAADSTRVQLETVRADRNALIDREKAFASDLDTCRKAAEELRQDRGRWRERAVHYAPAEKKLEYMNEGFAGRPERT